MTAVYALAAIVLLVTILAGLYRILRGPDPADRMAAVQLIGTTGIALTLLIGAAGAVPGAADVAILLALLAALTVTAFARLSVARTVDDRPRVDGLGADESAGPDATAGPA
ncbi:MAG: monovalent cation/H+ antiporter complex subunit F [Alphaproteobacteria bacterium]